MARSYQYLQRMKVKRFQVSWQRFQLVQNRRDSWPCSFYRSLAGTQHNKEYSICMLRSQRSVAIDYVALSGPTFKHTYQSTVTLDRYQHKAFDSSETAAMAVMSLKVFQRGVDSWFLRLRLVLARLALSCTACVCYMCLYHLIVVVPFMYTIQVYN